MIVDLLPLLVGCAAYFLVATIVAVVVHGSIRNAGGACYVATLISAVGLFLFIEWTSGFAVKPGWVFPILIPGCAIALPASAGVGWAFEWVRAVRSNGGDPGRGDRA